MSNGGVPRVLEKLSLAMSDGDHYEAYQMLKTLFYRYLEQNRYTELQEMLYEGALLFLKHRQFVCGADVGVMLVEVLTKSENKRFTEWTPRLCRIFARIEAPTPERFTFLESSLRWSSDERRRGFPKLHKGIALIYWNEKDYAQARSHFLYAKDGRSCARMLIEYQRTIGFYTEVDLFIAQTVFQYLCLHDERTANRAFVAYTKEHPRIGRSTPPFLMPLLNFLWFLLKAIDGKLIGTFVVLRHKYEASLERDPSFCDYMERIGSIFFGLPPAATKSNGFLGNMLQSFLDGLDADDEDSSDEDDSVRGQNALYRLPKCNRRSVMSDVE